MDVNTWRDTLTRMPPENMKLYNVRVKPSDWEKARAIAEAKGDRISDAVRGLILEYIRKNKRILDELEQQ